MADTEIQYTLSELGGCRLIEVHYPMTIDLSKLSTATARYLAIWESDLPTVQLNDVRETEVFDEVRANVLISMLRRNSTRPNYLGSAFWIGDNHQLVETLRSVLETAGRDPNCIFVTRAEALDYLRALVAEHGPA